MVLAIFDPRTGSQVKIWVPDKPSTPQPSPAAVIPLPVPPRG